MRSNAYTNKNTYIVTSIVLSSLSVYTLQVVFGQIVNGRMQKTISQDIGRDVASVVRLRDLAERESKSRDFSGTVEYRTRIRDAVEDKILSGKDIVVPKFHVSESGLG
jgi:hypothetical protein